MAKINLIFFKTPYDDELVTPLTHDLLSATNYNFQVEYDPRNVIRQINQIDNAVFLFYIHNKDDLQDALLIHTALQKFSHKKFFKYFAILTFDYTRSESIMKKIGCLGFFTPKEKPIRVAKKIDLLRRKMQPHLDKFRVDNIQVDIPQKTETPVVIESVKSKDTIQFIDPVDTPSDIWIVKDKSHCLKEMGGWKLIVKGPSAHLGKWTEISTIADEIPTWRYTLLNEQDYCLTPEHGFWYFAGQRPVFDWNQKAWIFHSSKPHLYFVSDFDKVYSRFYEEENILYVAVNSKDAFAKEVLISASAEAKFNVFNFNQLREEYLDTTWVREFSLESGEVSVNLQYGPNFDDFNLKCDFEDIHEQELIVVAPLNSMSNDVKVRANVSLEYAGKVADVNCLGRIHEVEQVGPDQDSLTIGIEQMKQESFEKFLELYQLRQANINDFMTRARGF